jgi:hypothetical protein
MSAVRCFAHDTEKRTLAHNYLVAATFYLAL